MRFREPVSERERGESHDPLEGWRGRGRRGGVAGGGRVSAGSLARREQSWSLVSLEGTAEVDAGRGIAGTAVFVGAGRRVGLGGSEVLLRGTLRGRSLNEP